MTLMLALLSLSGSMDMEELTARLHLETGMAMLQQGLLEQAEEEFQSALETGLEYSEALLGLGMVSARRSSWTAAEEYYRRYMRECPEDPRGYSRMAELFLDTGRPDSAVSMADSAFDLSPGDPDVWLLCGRTRLELEDLDEAGNWFSRGVDHGGDTALESLVLLASVHRRSGRGHEARDLLVPAADAGYSPACWELAKVYLDWEDYMRAEDAMRRYLLLSPDGTYADSAVLVLEELGESGEYMETLY